MNHPLRRLFDSFALAHIDAGAHQAATGHNELKPPTEAQQKAGNYKLGRVTFHGLKVAIENPRGSIRSGRDAAGKEWQSRMAAHYGYFEGTRGADGDAVDVFLGPLPESDAVWIINQHKPGGAFDEVKVMAGFATEDQARSAYLHSYERGWTGLQSIVPASVTQLKAWLKSGQQTGPVSPDQLESESPVMDRVIWNSAAEPFNMALSRVMYGLRSADATDGLLLDAVTMSDLMTAPEVEGVLVMDAMVVEVARLQQKMDALQRIMASTGVTVKPTATSISEPVKARGVLQVMVLFQMDDGQTVSVWFHNPDTTPSKLTPMDELISWKWMLNKRDVTIVVAPESGSELNPREVARRIMRLVDKNSEAFKKANAKAAERAAAIASLDTEIEQLTGRLVEVNNKIEVARVAFESKPKPADARGELSAGLDLTSFGGWVEAVTRLIEDQDVRRSDAQALVEAADAKLTAAFDAGKTPTEGADIVLNPAVDPEPAADESWRNLTDAELATPEGYAAILAAGDAALDRTMDFYDNLFGARLIALRNTLRRAGWEGQEWGDLTYKGALLEADPTYFGAGRNVVGQTYRVTLDGKAIYEVKDTLDNTPEVMAGVLHAYTVDALFEANKVPVDLEAAGAVWTRSGSSQRAQALFKAGFNERAVGNLMNRAWSFITETMMESRLSKLAAALIEVAGDVDTTGNDALAKTAEGRAARATWEAMEKLRRRDELRAVGATKADAESLSGMAWKDVVGSLATDHFAALVKALQPKEVAADPNIGREWRSDVGELLKVDFLRDGKYYCLKDGKSFGAPIIPAADLDKWIALDEQRWASRQEWLAEQDAKEKAAADAKEAWAAKFADIGGEDGESPMARARRVTTLSKQIRFDGEVMTSKDMIDKLVAGGAVTSTFEEDKIRPLSRWAFNRMNNAEQAAHARKVTDAGKVTRYMVGDYSVNKIEYDYANYLISKRPVEEVEPVDDAAPAGIYSTLAAFQAEQGKFTAVGLLGAELLDMSQSWRTHGKRLQDLAAVVEAADAASMDEKREGAFSKLRAAVRAAMLGAYKGSVAKRVIGPWMLQLVDKIASGDIDPADGEKATELQANSEPYRTLAAKDDAEDEGDVIPEVKGLDDGDSNVKMLMDYVAGAFDGDQTDTLSLGSHLRMIEQAIQDRIALNGALSEAEEALAQQAITHWAELDEKVNG